MTSRLQPKEATACGANGTTLVMGPHYPSVHQYDWLPCWAGCTMTYLSGCTIALFDPAHEPLDQSIDHHVRGKRAVIKRLSSVLEANEIIDTSNWVALVSGQLASSPGKRRLDLLVTYDCRRLSIDSIAGTKQTSKSGSADSRQGQRQYSRGYLAAILRLN